MAKEDFKNGNIQGGRLHSADAAVNATLLTVTAFFPASAPVTLAFGIVYNIWSATRD